MLYMTNNLKTATSIYICFQKNVFMVKIGKGEQIDTAA